MTQIEPGQILGANPPRSSTRQAAHGAASPAARQFEALAIERMLEPATRPLLARGLLDGGSGSAVARQLFVAELARIAAERGGIGLADRLVAGSTAGGTG